MTLSASGPAAGLPDPGRARNAELVCEGRFAPRMRRGRSPRQLLLACVTPTIGCRGAPGHHPGITRGRVNLAAPGRGINGARTSPVGACRLIGVPGPAGSRAQRAKLTATTGKAIPGHRLRGADQPCLQARVGQPGPPAGWRQGHAALTAGGRGRLPIWMRCPEYAEGRFSVLLARATAPYTVDQPLALIRRAWDAGAGPVLILDGLTHSPACASSRPALSSLALALSIPATDFVTASASALLTSAAWAWS